MRKILKNEGVQSLLTSLICIIVGMFVGYLVLLLIEPTGAFEAIMSVAKNFLGYSRTNMQLKHLGTTLAKTAPLIMCSLSIRFSYKVDFLISVRRDSMCMGACGLHGAARFRMGLACHAFCRSICGRGIRCDHRCAESILQRE